MTKIKPNPKPRADSLQRLGMALTPRQIGNWRIKDKMTPEQREWCLSEIDNVEGYERSNYATLPDDLLANGVLCAWMDYCRDKGLA